MFATFTFAEQPFAVQDVTGGAPPPVIVTSQGGNVSARRKKKYNLYEIFGKLYRLTEKEYEFYLEQRAAFERRWIKEQENKETTEINIDDLFEVPTVDVKSIAIPLIDKITVEHSYIRQLNRIIEEETAKELKRKQIQEEDDLILELLFTMGWI